MKITGDVVYRLAKWAKEVTGGQFVFSGAGADIGNGARYIDGVRQKVWLGRTGAREAAAYYVSGGVEWQSRTGGTVPKWVTEFADVLTSPAQPAAVQRAAEEGRDDAGNRFQTKP